MEIKLGARQPADVWEVIEGDTIGAGASVALPSGLRGTVTAVGPAYRSAPAPDEVRATITFLVEQAGGAGRDVVIGLLSAWLYDHRDRFRVWVNRRPLQLDDPGQIERVIGAELEVAPQMMERQEPP